MRRWFLKAKVTTMMANNLPNKPMVPTAPASPATNPSRPLRRHIGQPLDMPTTGGIERRGEQSAGEVPILGW